MTISVEGRVWREESEVYSGADSQRQLGPFALDEICFVSCASVDRAEVILWVCVQVPAVVLADIEPLEMCTVILPRQDRTHDNKCATRHQRRESLPHCHGNFKCGPCMPTACLNSRAQHIPDLCFSFFARLSFSHSAQSACRDGVCAVFRSRN